MSIGFIVSYISFFRNIENCPFFLCRQPIVCRVKQAKKRGGCRYPLRSYAIIFCSQVGRPISLSRKKNIVNLTAIIRTDLLFGW